MRITMLAAALGAAAVLLPSQSQRPSAAAIARSVDSLTTSIISGGLTPALGVAVVMDGKTILAKSYGWADITRGIKADDKTLWYLASTSKSLTGFGVTLLAQQHVLSFDDPIATLLPGVQWADGVDPHALTLARFLSHTHYLNDLAVVQSAAYTGAFPESEWPRLVRYAAPRSDRNLVYSNFGYNVAAMVIDAKRPEGWRRYLEDAVYKPAGMNDTYARVSGLESRIAMPHSLTASGAFATDPFPKRDATMNSAGGHVSTLHDLARWTIVHMDGGMLDGKRVFPAQAVELSHRLIAPHTAEGSKAFGPFSREGWGAGWDIGSYQGEPMVSRFGSYMTTRSHLSMLPRRRIGVVAMSTASGSSALTDIIASYAYDLEAGRANAQQVAAQKLADFATRIKAAPGQIAQAEEARRLRQRPMDRPLAEFAGDYWNEGFGTVTFSVRNDTLRYAWGVLSGPAEVYDAAKYVMRIELPGSGTTVPFEFSGPGPARAIEVQGVKFTRR